MIIPNKHNPFGTKLQFVEEKTIRAYLGDDCETSRFPEVLNLHLMRSRDRQLQAWMRPPEFPDDRRMYLMEEGEYIKFAAEQEAEAKAEQERRAKAAAIKKAAADKAKARHRARRLVKFIRRAKPEVKL